MATTKSKAKPVKAAVKAAPKKPAVKAPPAKAPAKPAPKAAPAKAAAKPAKAPVKAPTKTAAPKAAPVKAVPAKAAAPAAAKPAPKKALPPAPTPKVAITKAPAKPAKPAPAAPAAQPAPKLSKSATSPFGKPGFAPRPGGVPSVPVRTPERAEELKAKLGALASATNNIKSLKRSLQKSFYDIGVILADVQVKRLFEVKGYGSFEAYVERETELGKQLALRLVRVPAIFIKEAALAAGVERVANAVSVFDGDSDSSGSSPTGGLPRAALPPHKQ